MKKTVLDTLVSSSELIAFLTEYDDSPAVFFASAPEKAVKPYLTFELERTDSATSVVQSFNITVDYWHIDSTMKDARLIADIIEELFDLKRLKSDDYSAIRTWYENDGWVNESDPRTIRYSNGFSARASRKKWSNQLT